ncbi:MAG TPA: M20 family metallo-hydrolase [Casimicrobiaceae bacterium]|nr:M20 family metallo-hydrolase [Casimicrobiaceae bacterium]
MILADRIDAERLWSRHMRLARHGATPVGGVNRQALSAEEFAAWREVIAWGREASLAPFTDPAGNLFLRREGADPDATPVLTGSHLDSQPSGGKFDGVYGVLAGIEAAQAIGDAQMTLRRPIEVVAWMNEEGSRFAPGMMGSAAFTGVAPLERFLPMRDAQGVSVHQALAALHAAFSDLASRPLQRPIAAYVEAHIEQGPILEREGYSIGIVTGIQGKRTFRVAVKGEEAHAGTAEQRERKDALLAAVRMIHALDVAMNEGGDDVKFTVGRLAVTPNAPSVVPGEAVFSIDLRHLGPARLTALGDRVPALCAKHAGRCAVEVVELTNAMTLEFPESMRALIRRSATDLGIATLDLFSAAGHDARFLHAICPTGMIFIPCKDGVSHNPLESAKPEDLALGARVLAHTLVALASA